MAKTRKTLITTSWIISPPFSVFNITAPHNKENGKRLSENNTTGIGVMSVAAGMVEFADFFLLIVAEEVLEFGEETLFLALRWFDVWRVLETLDGRTLGV